MNAHRVKLVFVVILLAAGIRNGSSQAHVVGYAPCVFMTGSNLFNNPLVVGSNSLNNIFSPYGGPTVPNGTTVSLWNTTTSSFETNSSYSNGVWSVNLILPPGTGALVVTPSPFTNTVAGYLLNHDGSYITNDTLVLPNVFSGPAGIYLLGDKCPFPDDTGTNIFLNILGRMPYDGEQVTQISGTNTYTRTCLGNGLWDTVPFLAVGKAAFLNVKSEPPPQLTIICANNQAIVSWPSAVSTWTLQTNNDLSTGAWGNYAGTVVNNIVTNSTPAGNLFFRLTQP